MFGLSPSLTTVLRFDIPFCISREEESMLTPNRKLLWGSLFPSCSIKHSLPGNGGNEMGLWAVLVFDDDIACDRPLERGSRATRFVGQPFEDNGLLDLATLRRLDASS